MQKVRLIVYLGRKLNQGRESMQTANQVLIVGGVSILFFGMLLGIPMIVTRSRQARAPRYLFAAHLASIMQGTVLLAMSIAVGFSTLSSGIETTAAVLLLAGMALFNLGLVFNWLQGAVDAFKENTIGNKVSGLGTPLVLGGGGIVLFGVINTVI